MKVTIDLENKVIGKALIEYVQGSLDNLATLMQIDCKVEVVGYETRQDTEEDVFIFELVDAIHKQALIQFQYETGMPEPNPNTQRYDC